MMGVRVTVVALFISASVVAQTPPRDLARPPIAGTAIVSGVVFAGEAGETPARRTRVSISTNEKGIDDQTATTDEDGRFTFTALPAARYTLTAYKPGFHRAYYGASRPLRDGTPIPVADGARITGLTMRLLRGAAITGTVRDHRGRPMPDVPVTALRITYTGPGDRNIGLASSGSSTTTDDRGVYRVWGLVPGEYLLMAKPALGIPLSSTGPGDFRRPGADDVRANYAPVFYPGTTSADQAVMIVLAGESERTGVDIAMMAVPTTSVSGTVTPATSTAKGDIVVTLASAGEVTDMLASVNQLRPQTAMAMPDGRFEFLGVTPGRYTVLAKTRTPNPTSAPSSPVMWARSTIDVNGAPIDVSLALQPALTVTGRIVFEGTSPPPSDVTTLSVRLVPPGPGSNLSAGPGAQVNKDATFTITGVTPGPYRLVQLFRTIYPGEWGLTSAKANGQNVLDGFTIAPSQSTDLVLTFADRHSELAGTLQDATGRPAPDYFIVVFPGGRQLWRSPYRLVSRRPATDGKFSIRGLLAGDYYVAALTDFQTEDMYTPSFLDGLTTPAQKVTISEGQVTKLDLRIGK